MVNDDYSCTEEQDRLRKELCRGEIEMKLNTYNARRAKIFGKKLTASDIAILFRSDPHTHSEVQFSERYGNISFSSTLKDGAKGTRFKQIEYSHEDERWDTVEIAMTQEEEANAYAMAEALLGRGYDLFGLLGYATPLNIIRPSKTKLWCSEACARVISIGRPDFRDFLKEINMMVELNPFQLDTLARYYFKRRVISI